MMTIKDIINETLKSIKKKVYTTTVRFLAKINPFPVDGNFPLTLVQRAVMTKLVQLKLEEVFKILKFDFEDPNFKDTPSRVASMWVNELMIGRFLEKPRLEAFPVEEKHLRKFFRGLFPSLISDGNALPFPIDAVLPDDAKTYNGLIIKKIDIRSLCSHHLMPFFTEGENSFALVAYKPTTKFLGISKIQRLAHWLGARPQLQEQLTFNLFEEMTNTLDSDNVFVILKNLTHTCETLRGAKTECGSTTTLYYGGIFHDASLRKEVIDAVN